MHNKNNPGLNETFGENNWKNLKDTNTDSFL